MDEARATGTWLEDVASGCSWAARSRKEVSVSLPRLLQGAGACLLAVMGNSTGTGLADKWGQANGNQRFSSRPIRLPPFVCQNSCCEGPAPAALTVWLRRKPNAAVGTSGLGPRRLIRLVTSAVTAHICAIKLSPNAEHLISVAPHIGRVKS